MMSKDLLIRKHITVTGRVQGVGFRAFTQYLATNLDVNGWVRNVGYDQVEIVAEASPDVMELFINEVSRGPRHSNVTAVKVDDEPSTGEFSIFDIRG